MNNLITEDNVHSLYLWPICLLICLILYGPVITAHAATFPEVPADHQTFTKKTENYNPEYEYCLNQIYSTLPSLGHESAVITVPGFVGTEDEARAFSKYIYQYYDYTGQLKISCSPTTSGSQLYNLHIHFSDPNQIYEMQLETEKKLYDFSQSLSGLSDREKIVKANNWVASNATYDETLKKTSCYFNVVEGSSTCNGYARAFYAICCYSGIRCENIRGYVDNKLHIWNRVYVDQDWEYIDVTWNSMSHSDTWLLVSKDTIDKDHIPSS